MPSCVVQGCAAKPQWELGEHQYCRMHAKMLWELDPGTQERMQPIGGVLPGLDTDLDDGE